MEEVISRYLLKLRRSNPFLATVSLMANYRFDSSTELFETDGRVITINTDYFSPLTESERTGLLLHLTLHSALLHPHRLASRDPGIWNVAADIVVNNIIVEAGDFTPPKNTAIEPKYRDLSVEQVYEALLALFKDHLALQTAALKLPKENEQQNPDFSDQQSGSAEPTTSQRRQVIEQLYACQKDLVGRSTQDQSGRPQKPAHTFEKSAQYWQGALRRAEAAARLNSQSQGNIPAGLHLEIGQMMSPIMDWRSLLWQFVVRTPDDYGGYDRRFVHQGLYLDHLESERLNVLVAIDTSGSISEEELTHFMSELLSIANAYHFIVIELYYVDADIYGPYELSEQLDEMMPRGGGGTNFDVFYEKVVNNKHQSELDLVVYFTDGFGDFPTQEPGAETMWVVTFGGLDSDSFPFGTVARLSNI